jgi:hypothetical protein
MVSIDEIYNVITDINLEKFDFLRNKLISDSFGVPRVVTEKDMDDAMEVFGDFLQEERARENTGIVTNDPNKMHCLEKENSKLELL